MSKARVRAMLFAAIAGLMGPADSQSPSPVATTTVMAIIMPESAVSSITLEVPDDPDSSATANPHNRIQTVSFPVRWRGRMSIRDNVRLSVRFRNGDSYVLPLRLTRGQERVPVQIFQSQVASCWPSHLSNRLSQGSSEALEQMAIAARMYSIRDHHDRCGDTAGRQVTSKWLTEALRLTDHSINFRLSQAAVDACREFRCATDQYLADTLLESERRWIVETFDVQTRLAYLGDFSGATERLDQLLAPVLTAANEQDRADAIAALEAQDLTPRQLLEQRADYQVLAAQRGQQTYALSPPPGLRF